MWIKKMSNCWLPLVISLCLSCTSNPETDTDLAQGGLSHKAPDTPASEPEIIEEPEVVPSQIDEVIESKAGQTEDKQVQIGSEKDEINESIKLGIPIEINAKVEKWIAIFTNRHRKMFQTYLDRGEYYKNVVVTTLRDQGIPTELYYLAMIESGYNTRAYSSAHAAGIWQFIAATGRRYGLRIDSYSDERRDPIRATIAAAMYLNDLYNVFNSWYLAMAAYNAGELRIMRAIMRGKSRSFWELARGHFLPPETMQYIPKFLAALTIGKNPQKYGFEINRLDAPHLESTAVPSPIRLKRLAAVTGIPLKEIKKHNPHLKRSMTPPGEKAYLLWLPKIYQELINTNQTKLKQYVLNIPVYKRKIIPRYHRVRRGETLGSIARRYGLSIKTLKGLNGLRNNLIVAGKRLYIRGSKSTGSKNGKYYVRHGDNLYIIAKRFGTTVRNLKKLNKLNSNRIYAGQLLNINKEKI